MFWVINKLGMNVFEYDLLYILLLLRFNIMVLICYVFDDLLSDKEKNDIL